MNSYSKIYFITIGNESFCQVERLKGCVGKKKVEILRSRALQHYTRGGGGGSGNEMKETRLLNLVEKEESQTAHLIIKIAMHCHLWFCLVSKQRVLVS